MAQDWIKKIKEDRLVKLIAPEKDVESQTGRNVVKEKISETPALNDSARNDLVTDD